MIQTETTSETIPFYKLVKFSMPLKISATRYYQKTEIFLVIISILSTTWLSHG